ncbi:MAG: response regulator [Actinomycetota bacterium]|nr:response regulator [Actinomycetota bacterium]
MTAYTTRTGGTSAKVLVVDNDARVRAALCALIGSSPGLSVAGEASSRSAAYAAMEALRPDVVVLDILLPSAADGLEVLKDLAATGRPVVALSIRYGLRAAALDAGAVAFVEKYAGPDALLETLRSVVARLPSGH